ncbi:MAG: PspA/IM30 family protein [Candidatus Methanolliviera sp. GoM_asphalt]|nr:MAG: PspA/IM30 family protein [Candidatus Methanolliviera sp. GoM_asphalt]
MGLIDRFSNVAKAKASKLIERFEDPAEQVDYAYEKLLEEKKRVDLAVRDSIAAKNLKKRELNEAQKKVASVHNKALGYRKRALALESKIDDLEGKKRDRGEMQIEELNNAATQLLEEENRTKERIPTLQQSVSTMEKKVRTLKDKQIDLSAKIQRFADKRADLKADYAMAKASTRVNDAISGIDGEISDTDLTMQRMAEKVKMEEARAEASAELVTGVEISDMNMSDIEKELNIEQAISSLDEEIKEK